MLLKRTLLLILLSVCAMNTYAQKKSTPKLLIRVDDIGMNHDTNLALKKLAETGIRFSATVMTPCPWFQEATDILKANPQIAVGVHLTLNSEWKNYRWGPVLGKEAVPSLVASDGYFHPSVNAFIGSGYQLEEVRKELDAQIKKAIDAGLHVVFIDFHMRTAVQTPELEQITVELAHKYGLKRSMRLNEAYMTIYDVDPDKKQTEFIHFLKSGMDPDKVNLVVNHIAIANPETKALQDMNNPSQFDESRSLVATHRQAELDALLSEEFHKMIKEKKIELVNYGDL